jgi:pyruvate/2-oxoglutarate dehydrogenase complex dihydrolipoamide dehydrogenase (E3) component
MHTSNSYKVILIGGGSAGITAAWHACELGARVAPLERDNLGGTCTNDGCMPARVLAKAARQIGRELERVAPAPQWRTLRPLNLRAVEWEQAHG